MAALPQSRLVTYEEWLEMPVVQDAVEEVVNGEIRIMPPNKFPHPLVVRLLQQLFFRQLDFRTAEFLSSVFGLVISREPLICRTPDAAVFERATMLVEDGYVHSAPQLAIEVLSPTESRKKIEEKLRDYESIGTAEIWLVSPEAATVEVLLLKEGKLHRSGIYADGVLKPKHFSDVQIDIAEIWPD